MSKSKHGHHSPGPHDAAGKQGDRRPYWQRAHHDWRFRVAAILMLVAMAVYVLGQAVALQPRSAPREPPPSASGK